MHGRAGRLVLGAVVGSVLLTACGQAQPGVAASIDGETLTVDEVHDRTASFFASHPQFEAEVSVDRVTAITVENFLRANVVDTIGEEFGLEPSQGDLDAIVEELGGLEAAFQAISNAGIGRSSELLMVELRSVWIQRELRARFNDEIDDPEQAEIATSEALREFSEDADVSINPRFGSWDGSVVTATNGSLSTPLDQLAPTEGAAPAPPG